MKKSFWKLLSDFSLLSSSKSGVTFTIFPGREKSQNTYLKMIRNNNNNGETGKCGA